MKLAALLLLLAAPAPLCAQNLSPDSAKRIEIRRLLAVEHTDSLMLEGMDLGFRSSAAQLPPGMPEGFMDSLRARTRRDIGVFVERLVPVYDSLYTKDEIDQMIVFYQTPLGRRILGTQAALAAAVGELARRWGMEEAGQIIVDLSKPSRP